MPLPFALHSHIRPPPPVVPSNTYGGTRTPTPYDAEDAQAVYPAPPLQTQKPSRTLPPTTTVCGGPACSCSILPVFSTHRPLPTRGYQPPTTTHYFKAFRSTARITHATTASGFLQCGDVHPNPGHRRIYQLRRDCRLVSGPPVPLLDIEEYAQHLVVNTNRQYESLDNVANEQDRDMKLATWNIQGSQGTFSLQR